MPKKEMDYSKTVIYKLCCKNPEITDVYVGHTTNYTKRKCRHKCNCNNPNSRTYNYKVYQFIRDNGNWDNFSMIVIEEYNCSSRLEAEARERHWIETLNASLNCVIPTRTKKEYMEVNSEKIKEQNKQYREQYSEKVKEQKKQYREQNLEKIRESQNKKIECECGCMTTANHMARHKRSEKHIKLMEELNVA